MEDDSPERDGLTLLARLQALLLAHLQRVGVFGAEGLLKWQHRLQCNPLEAVCRCKMPNARSQLQKVQLVVKQLHPLLLLAPKQLRHPTCTFKATAGAPLRPLYGRLVLLTLQLSLFDCSLALFSIRIWI